MGHITIREMAMYALAFLLALTVHEYAHARAALAAGDDTARNAGRVSLNPLDHLDTIGTLMFFASVINGFGIAWGKPVPVNPYNFKSPRWDSLRVSLWGPMSNVITSFALALLLRFVVEPWIPTYAGLIEVCIVFNLAIAFFNLIPIHPLDGSHILSALLPPDAARRYELMMGRYGLFILVVALVTGAVSWLIKPVVLSLYRVMTGF